MVYDHAVDFDQQVDQDVKGLLGVVIVKKKHVIQLDMAPVFSLAGQVAKALADPHFSSEGAVEFAVFDAMNRRLAFGIILPEQSHGIFTFDDLLLSHVNFFQSWHRCRLHKRTAG